jgi:hypothetical protein
MMVMVMVVVIATSLRGRNWQSKGDGSQSSYHESDLPHKFSP